MTFFQWENQVLLYVLLLEFQSQVVLQKSKYSRSIHVKLYFTKYYGDHVAFGRDLMAPCSSNTVFKVLQLTQTPWRIDRQATTAHEILAPCTLCFLFCYLVHHEQT